MTVQVLIIIMCNWLNVVPAELVKLAFDGAGDVTGCPTRYWNPRFAVLNSPMYLEARYSTNYLLDSFLAIDTDFNIHRLQKFENGCFFNLTYAWNESSEQFMSVPIPEIGIEPHPILVYWNSDFTMILMYECLNTSRSFAEFHHGYIDELTNFSSYENFIIFGFVAPRTRNATFSDTLALRKEAKRLCNTWSNMQPKSGFSIRQICIFLFCIILFIVLCLKISSN